MVDSLPLRGLAGGSVFSIEGRPPLPPDQRPVGLIRFVDRSYFQTMGIPLLSGRGFADADTTKSPPVIIVNRMVARRFWPEEGGGSPIGGRISVVAANGSVAEIVGVVGDVKSERIEREDWPTIYYPYTQVTPTSMTFVVKTAGNPGGLIAAAAREIRQMDPGQAMPDILTMEEIVDRAVEGARFNTVVLAVFAGIAFLLAAVGIYGVVSYDVSQRTGEIGIRMALGAQKRDVLKLVLGQGAKLAAYGIALGLAAAFGLTHLMSAMLYGVNPADAVTFAAISLLLGAVAVAASYLPSRRAMALDPVTALRHE
jgi:predicted permease